MLELLAEDEQKRVFIFARDHRAARNIAEYLQLPPRRWHYINDVFQIQGVHPSKVITITAPGFATGRPQSFEAHRCLMARAQVYNVKIPSFDPP